MEPVSLSTIHLKRTRFVVHMFNYHKNTMRFHLHEVPSVVNTTVTGTSMVIAGAGESGE